MRLRTLVVGDLPLLVASVPISPTGTRLVAALADRGLPPLEGFVGVELPRGARVGFLVDRERIRLLDDREQALLQAPRDGLDPAWLEAARRLKGTMAVVALDLPCGPDTPAEQLVGRVEFAARRGEVHGAIVGVAEERPTLPLMFG